MPRMLFLFRGCNRPFSSCSKPLFQCEAKCEIIDMKTIFLFSCKYNSFAQERFRTQPRFESEFLELGNGLLNGSTIPQILFEFETSSSPSSTAFKANNAGYCNGDC